VQGRPTNKKSFFLGLEIDTLEMVKRIPQDKLVEVRHKLHMVLSKKKVTLKEYSQFIQEMKNIFQAKHRMPNNPSEDICQKRTVP
jgi:hypothetical protein